MASPLSGRIPERGCELFIRLMTYYSRVSGEATEEEDGEHGELKEDDDVPFSVTSMLSSESMLLDTETETEGMAASVKDRLLHQLRNLEGDQRAYREESERTITRQLRELNQLQHEHESLATNMALLISPQKIRKDINDSTQIKTLIQTKEQYDCLAEQEKNLIAKLDAQIKDQEEKIIKHKMSTGGIRSVHQRRRHLQKQIQTLENQLNLATIKFNTILTENCKLREEINVLRVNKEIYIKLYNKLSAKLQEQKKIMKDIVEESIQAYDQRMEAETRINAVKERSAKDILLYNTEIKELMRIIDHESRLKDFMLIKFRQFTKEDQSQDKIGKKTAQEIEYEAYEEVYNQLKHLTGRDNLYSLGNEFIATEEKNYALFNFINEINIQLEQKQEKIQNIKDEILQIQNQRGQSEAEMHRLIKELERALESTTQQTNKYERMYTHVSKTLDQLKSSVESLAKKIHCDLTPIQQKLCGNEGILNFNALDYLGIIERKAIDLLQLHMLTIQLAELEKETPPLSPASSVTSTPKVNILLAGSELSRLMKPIKIFPPVIDDDIEVETEKESARFSPAAASAAVAIVFSLRTPKGFMLAVTDMKRSLCRGNKDRWSHTLGVESHSAFGDEFLVTRLAELPSLQHP
ncbi:coiled-coil domain-containing protein 63-like [Pristis pectinata]|uniref:coiled-coil domain-containing protein 63-like n=1 Tax=Pristis pectinata TaxID=685728 RepID=UPI00223D9092|nr:coiled-coil domain-containing protein 63-like [Pristis pectinata]